LFGVGSISALLTGCCLTPGAVVWSWSRSCGS